MPLRIQILGAVAASLACLAGAPAAWADDELPQEQAASPPLRAALPSPFGAIRALDDKALSYKRGGTDVFSDMKLKGVVADNQATNLTTGSNVISDGAFSGAAGLPMVIQNSGNNVLIQSATIVNVQVK
jgi:hypothetical protein